MFRKYEISYICDVKIYPNPSSSVFHIERATVTPANIQVKDLKGRVLLSRDSVERHSMINLSHLPRGIYLFEMQSEQGRYVEKIILE